MAPSICTFEGQRPFREIQVLKLDKAACDTSLTLSLASDTLVQDILTNRQNYIDRLIGTLSTGASSKEYQVELERY
jgi:hypothetical protein